MSETEVFNASYGLLDCIALFSKKKTLSLKEEETVSHFRESYFSQT